MTERTHWHAGLAWPVDSLWMAVDSAAASGHRRGSMAQIAAYILLALLGVGDLLSADHDPESGPGFWRGVLLCAGVIALMMVLMVIIDWAGRASR